MRKAAHARAISLNQPMPDTARRSDEQVAKESNDMNNIATNTQTQGSSNTTSPLNQSGQTSIDTAVATATALPRQVPESVDEVLQVLKTAFPLLVLSLETMVDQIHQKFKPPPEEDIYRHIYLLLGDAISVRAFIGVNVSTQSLYRTICYE